ncbi:MAG: ATP-grasp domain-containing protein [Clostridia bacterium]|nr:ATP-grasp domain-containing protein [Clostridia bacterium]
MMSKGAILILYNKVSKKAAKDQIDVLYQVNAVSEALEQLGYAVCKHPFPEKPKDIIETLKETKPSVIFNLVETVAGSEELSYLAPSIFEAMNMKYTGNNAEASILTSDKLVTKKLLRSCGIETPPWITARDENGFEEGERYIVKPVYGDGSVDLNQDSIVTAESVRQVREILAVMKEKTDRDFFAEKYIEGREINVSLLGENGKPLILPPTEIKFVGYKEKHIYEILTYRSKWEEDSFEYKNAVSSGAFEDEDKVLLENLEDIAEKCWYEFGLKGYARVDFRIDKSGRPYALEINTNPCITPGESSFIKSAIHGGLDYAGVVEKIISEA